MNYRFKSYIILLVQRSISRYNSLYAGLPDPLSLLIGGVACETNFLSVGMYKRMGSTGISKLEHPALHLYKQLADFSYLSSANLLLLC